MYLRGGGEAWGKILSCLYTLWPHTDHVVMFVLEKTNAEPLVSWLPWQQTTTTTINNDTHNQQCHSHHHSTSSTSTPPTSETLHQKRTTVMTQCHHCPGFVPAQVSQHEPSPNPLLTMNPGATSLSATWQPDTKQTTNNPTHIGRSSSSDRDRLDNDMVTMWHADNSGSEVSEEQVSATNRYATPHIPFQLTKPHPADTIHQPLPRHPTQPHPTTQHQWSMDSDECPWTSTSTQHDYWQTVMRTHHHHWQMATGPTTIPPHEWWWVLTTTSCLFHCHATSPTDSEPPHQMQEVIFLLATSPLQASAHSIMYFL